MNDPIGEARAILKRYFGYDAFWPLQEDIIGHLLAKIKSPPCSFMG
jgi:superfamily II DNA helicase RecQ